MASAHPPSHKSDRSSGSPPRCDDDPDLQLLLSENTRLRELVVQLSRLVIRNAVDQK
jgi:hypothetical protein